MFAVARLESCLHTWALSCTWPPRSSCSWMTQTWTWQQNSSARWACDHDVHTSTQQELLHEFLVISTVLFYTSIILVACTCKAELFNVYLYHLCVQSHQVMIFIW